MNWQSAIRPWRRLAILGGVALLTAVAWPGHANADMYNRLTILTVNQPVQVENTVLDPGTYVFKLAESSSNRNIVLIYNQDETHLINSVMTVPAYRVRRTGDTRFSFWETPPGTARALRDWYYPGDNNGQEFRYPSHPRVIETAYSSNSTATVPEAPPTPAATTEAPPAAPLPAAQESLNFLPPADQPVEIAQNTPPPAPAPAAESQSNTPSTSTENNNSVSADTKADTSKDNNSLPQTASPFPLIGLGGLFSLALYGFFRLSRAQ